MLSNADMPDSHAMADCSPLSSQASAVSLSCVLSSGPRDGVYVLSVSPSHHHMESTGCVSFRSLETIICAIPGSMPNPIYSPGSVLLVFDVSLSLSTCIAQQSSLLSKVRVVSKPVEVSYSSSYEVYKAMRNLRYSTFSNTPLGETPQTAHFMSQSSIQYDL